MFISLDSSCYGVQKIMREETGRFYSLGMELEGRRSKFSSLLDVKQIISSVCKIMVIQFL